MNISRFDNALYTKSLKFLKAGLINRFSKDALCRTICQFCGDFNSSTFVCKNPTIYSSNKRIGTTILCVRKGDKVCLAGDGMVSQGTMIVKQNAKKIRKLDNNVMLGFAGTTADCFTLVEKLESKLEEYPGQLLRACVELAKQWRTDRYLRHLEAVLIAADGEISLEVTGNGDVLEMNDGILGIGSGGPYAVAAARALYDVPNLDAVEIALKSMNIAADMCCHTNHRILHEVITNLASSKNSEQKQSLDDPELKEDDKSDIDGITGSNSESSELSKNLSGDMNLNKFHYTKDY